MHSLRSELKENVDDLSDHKNLKQCERAFFKQKSNLTFSQALIKLRRKGIRVSINMIYVRCRVQEKKHCI